MADTGTSKRTDQVRSVERAARIASALAEHPYPMSVSEIARRVQLSPASVHRLLSTMVRIGWIEQNTRTARYRLGTRLMGIGSAGLVTNPVVQFGKVTLARLAAITRYDAVLSTLVGGRSVHLARVQGELGRALDFEAGISQPAHAMADGKLLLAHVPPEERRYLYGVEQLVRYTDHTITEPEALELELEHVRDQGYAVDRHERFAQVSGLAVPVLGTDGEPILAMLTIGRFELDEEFESWLRDEMQSLARELSAQLIEVGDMPRPGVAMAQYNLE